MKIALLTIWHVGNYGAELQAYATIKTLTALGHDVSIIDIRENEHPTSSLKAKAASMIGKFTPAYHNFNKFWKEYFPQKTKHYHSIEELIANPPKADAYIVGSDQVWNPDITKEKTLIYFLNFGSPSVLRISYASSFGSNQWKGTVDLTNEIKKLLEGFNAISCREKSGVSILKSVWGIDAKRVLDPTLLISDYSEFTGPIKVSQTLVYYPLTQYPQLEIFCMSLAKTMGLKLVNANETRMLTNSIPWKRPCVQSWVKKIAEAAFVVTPSFHGLAFSIIFRRQFMIINRGGSIERRARMIDLLEELGLSERFCESFSEAQSKRLWERPIDFEKVYERLAIMRQESINFLKDSLA